MCAVPVLRGDSVRQAQRELRRAHCRLGHVSRLHARRPGRWVVVSQRVRAGAHRGPGKRVGVVVERIVRRRMVAGGASTPKHGALSREPKLTPRAGAPPSGLVVRERIAGLGVAARPGEKITVNYVGALYGGKVVDTSWAHRQPFTFRMGSGEVIEGWEKGLRGMRVGGRRELIIPAREAYWSRGSPPAVPPNATLVFIVDLLAV